MKTQTVRGFRDFIGQEAQKRMKIKGIIQEQFELYGFEPAETPIIEFEEFVKSDNSDDEAVRDIFKLEDRGKRKLALRYEFTFQLKRIAQNQKLPYKRYQIGYNFRDEPIRKGRTRQFIQCDADIVGSSIKDEAECLKLGKNIFEKLNIPVKIYVNNRKLINEILISEKIEEKNRNQVIRELDKLDKLSIKEVKVNLKKYNAENLLEIFTKKEKYFERYNSYKEIIKLKELCKLFNVKIEFRPYLARGFSYYNGSVFEVWSKKMNVAICGGGSYLIDGKQSTGISFGLEPLFLLTKIKPENTKFLILSINQDKEAIKIAQKLRSSGKRASIFYGKPSKALEYANSYKIKKIIFIGKEEIKEGKIKIKDMETGREKLITIEEFL